MATPVIFVNADNAGSCVQDGKCWATAFSDLQSALDQAQKLGSRVDVWVAKGTYIPSKVYSPNGVVGGAYGVNTPFLRTFNIPNGVSLYGGFCGTERRLQDRPKVSSGTVLNGAQSVWHVVMVGNDVAQTGAEVLLDNITVMAGGAIGPTLPMGFPISGPLQYAHSMGGGIYSVFGSTLTLNNCNINGNSAGIPGSTDGYGGGVLSNNSNLYINGGSFNCNVSSLEGGGLEIICSWQTTPTQAIIKGATFDSQGGYFGGGAVSEGAQPHPDSSTFFSECNFTRNTAYEGGAVVVDSLDTTFTGCVFERNTAYVNGGALTATSVVNAISNPNPNVPPRKAVITVNNCTFKNNVAIANLQLHDSMFGGPSSGIDFPLGGGAITVYMNGICNVFRCDFVGNKALGGEGGAILNGNSAAIYPLGSSALAYAVNLTVDKSTFCGNSALNGNGGAIASLPTDRKTLPDGSPIPIEATVMTLTNNYFSGNYATELGTGVYIYRSTVRYCDNTLSCDCGSVGVSVGVGNNTYIYASEFNGQQIGEATISCS